MSKYRKNKLLVEKENLEARVKSDERHIQAQIQFYNQLNQLKASMILVPDSKLEPNRHDTIKKPSEL